MSETTVIECPNCGATFKAKSKAALGKKVACPKCKVPFVISAPSSSSKSKKPQQAAAKQDAWDDLWDEEDDLEASPPPREKANRPRGRSAKRNPSSGDSLKWIGLVAIVVIVGGGIGLIALNSGGSGGSSENLAAKLATTGAANQSQDKEEVSETVTPEPTEAKSTEPEATENAKPQMTVASSTTSTSAIPEVDQSVTVDPSLTPAQAAATHLLVFEIIKLDSTITNSIKNSRQNKARMLEMLSRSTAQVVDTQLKKSDVLTFIPRSTQVDLSRNLLSLQADPRAARQIADSINKNASIKVQVAETAKVVALELPEEEADEEGVDYEVKYVIEEIDESISKQIAANPVAGESVLSQLLNHQLSQKYPDYIADSVKLDLEYHVMTMRMTRCPSVALYMEINRIPSIPVKLNLMINNVRQLRTPEKIQPTQLTYKIKKYKKPDSLQYVQRDNYDRFRDRIISGLYIALADDIFGYVPGSLRVDLVNETVTFQFDHEPEANLARRLNQNFFNDLILSDQPIKTGPPEPPFRTPGRPMRLVVLRVIEADGVGTVYFSDLHPDEVKAKLAQDYDDLNHYLAGEIDGYIADSAEGNPQEMLIAIQLDQIPPPDLAKMINAITLFDYKVADEFVAVHEVQYDPESSEKTMFFNFINHNEKAAQFRPERVRAKVETELADLPRYIPGSLQMDFEKGTLSVRMRIGLDDRWEKNHVIHSLTRLNLQLSYLNSLPPQGKNQAHPKGIGVVAGSAADKGQGSSMLQPAGQLAKGEHLKVTIQYGLYAGKTNIVRSARSALDGFTWIDLKTFQVDEAKKEITFETTGEMNVPALDRLLKRQKFYQCVINSEALPEPEGSEK